METADAAIVGAGVVGLAVAYELAKSGVKSIAVLERQNFPGMGSTACCTGGIRLQFSSKANINFSKFGLEKFISLSDEMGTDIGLKKAGYLFLITSKHQVHLYSMGHKLQKSLGVDTYFVDKSWIGKYADFLNLEDVISGSYCPLEAHASPHSVIESYLKAMRSLGVDVYTNREVTGIGISGDRVTGISTNKGPISTGIIVNCAGPWAGNIASMAGSRLPIVTRKRHVLVIKPPSSVNQNMPLIVDIGSGLYFKPEAGNLMLMGGTDRNGQVSQETLRHPETIDRIIEAGIKRAPAFENAGHIKTIVGLRALSPDDHSIIGKIPNVKGFYCAAGFSGHGFMHAPAAAAALTELILYERSILFDLTAFDPSRFERRARKRAHEKYVF